MGKGGVIMARSDKALLEAWQVAYMQRDRELRYMMRRIAKLEGRKDDFARACELLHEFREDVRATA
jgi:hypothetical protein